MERESEKELHLRDADAIRALIHPARQQVVNVLFAAQRSYTSTELSALTGLTPSAMSYHLRELEKRGIVERVDGDGTDARTRPWRATGTSIRVHGSEAEGVWEAQDALAALALTSLRERLRAFRSDRSEARESYVGIGESTLWLTEQEAAKYIAAIDNVECELMNEGWRNEPAPGRRLTRSLYSLLPDVPVRERSDNT